LQQETKRIYFDGWPTICFQLARYVLWNFWGRIIAIENS
jgi:hypothetical protein